MRGNDRYIYLNTHGAYQVDLPLPPKVADEEGRAYRTKTFYPSRFGAPETALRAARTWRDNHGTEFFGDEFYLMLNRGRELPKRKPRAGSSAIAPGVHAKKLQGRITAWAATWSWINQDGSRTVKSRTFSLSVYGEDEARNLALKAREEGLEEALLNGRKVDGAKPVSSAQKRFRRDQAQQGWVVTDTTKRKPTERLFRDKAYRQGIDGESPSWWSFIEALCCQIDLEVKAKGVTYLPRTEAKARLYYEQILESSHSNVEP